MINNFKDFNLSPKILRAIDGLGYKKPSDVQAKVIPLAMKDKNLIVKSQTGSGKTAAFAIPLCEKISWEEHDPQVLVLTPTRELAIQVKEDISNIGIFKRIKAATVYGKHPFSEEKLELKQKTHMVIGTPGRVQDHIDRGTLPLSSIRYLVIDEADEMFSMGFIGQIESIIKSLPCDRVSMLFSATMPEEIISLCDRYLSNAEDIEIKAQKLITDNIDHSLYRVDFNSKIKSLMNILIKECPESAIIFCRTKENVDLLFDDLNKRRMSIGKIHGGMMQPDRLKAMENFRRGAFRILIATDVAARGIDIENITHVINFDLPVEMESYVHRSGRTGRAGAKGKAISLVSQYDERLLNSIEEYIGFKIPEAVMPSEEEILPLKAKAMALLRKRPEAKNDKSKDIKKDIMKIYMNGGKKKKIRAGDIVGAICNIKGVSGDDIGIIDVQDMGSYVEILNGKGNIVLKALQTSTLKGKKLKVEKARK